VGQVLCIARLRQKRPSTSEEGAAAAATATAVALYEHVCPTCCLFLALVLVLFLHGARLYFSSPSRVLHCYYSCDRSAAATNSEVRPGQILGSEIAIGQAHASGQKKNLEGTVHRGSWEQPGCTFQDGTRAANHHMGQAWQQVAGGRRSLLKGGSVEGAEGGTPHSSAAGATSACEKASWHFCS
jgi:hypothetical protein